MVLHYTCSSIYRLHTFSFMQVYELSFVAPFIFQDSLLRIKRQIDSTVVTIILQTNK